MRTHDFQIENVPDKQPISGWLRDTWLLHLNVVVSVSVVMMVMYQSLVVIPGLHESMREIRLEREVGEFNARQAEQVRKRNVQLEATLLLEQEQAIRQAREINRELGKVPR